MPNYKVEYKSLGKIETEYVAANDPAEAQKQVQSKFPGADILKVVERGANAPGAQPMAKPRVEHKKSGSMVPMLVIVLIILGGGVAAAWFFKDTLMGMLGGG